MKIKVSVMAKELGKSIDVISDRVRAQIKTAVKQLSLNTFAEAQRLANHRLDKGREDYLNSLKYQELKGQDIYVIYLDGEGKFYEKGWESYDMKPGLLNGPKSKPTADGKGRFNTVPFKKRGTAPKGSPVNIADTAAAIKRIAKDNSLERIEKQIKGGTITTYKGIEDPMLKGLTKVTQLYKTKTGKDRKSSQYFVFRRVSSKTDPSKWIHPGYKGAKVFPDLKKYVEKNLRIILKEIL